MVKRVIVLGFAAALCIFSTAALANNKFLPSHSELSAITKACLLVVPGKVDTLDLRKFGYKVSRANSKKLHYIRRNKIVSGHTPFTSTLKYSRSLEGRKGFVWLCELDGFYGLDIKDAKQIITSELKAAGYTLGPAPKHGIHTNWIKGQRKIKMIVSYNRFSGDFHSLTMSTR